MAAKQKDPDYNIEWTASSLKQLQKTLDYIAEQSVQNAQSLLESIDKMLKKAAANPEINPRDKYKLNNTAFYRSFEIKKCRITYRIVTKEK